MENQTDSSLTEFDNLKVTRCLTEHQKKKKTTNEITDNTVMQQFTDEVPYETAAIGSTH